MQIVLVVTVLFAAVWFVALRPKAPEADSSPAATPAAQTPATAARGSGSSLPGSLGRSVRKARDASAASDAANAARDNAEAASTGEPATSSSPSASASTASATAGASSSASAKAANLAAARRAAAPKPTATPARVQQAIARGQVVAMLFWDKRTSVDRAVRLAIGKAGRRGGGVFVAAAPIGMVSKYASITRGVQVLQAPTIVVVDRKRHATLLIGFVDRGEIAQAVADARAASRR